MLKNICCSPIITVPTINSISFRQCFGSGLSEAKKHLYFFLSKNAIFLFSDFHERAFKVQKKPTAQHPPKRNPSLKNVKFPFFVGYFAFFDPILKHLIVRNDLKNTVGHGTGINVIYW
jgi:hypothetical protein